jgi:hypothetical protein
LSTKAHVTTSVEAPSMSGPASRVETSFHRALWLFPMVRELPGVRSKVTNSKAHRTTGEPLPEGSRVVH